MSFHSPTSTPFEETSSRALLLNMTPEHYTENKVKVADTSGLSFSSPSSSSSGQSLKRKSPTPVSSAGGRAAAAEGDNKRRKLDEIANLKAQIAALQQADTFLDTAAEDAALESDDEDAEGDDLTREEVQRHTLRTFFDNRSFLVDSADEWLETVNEAFTLTLPMTTYREYDASQVEDGYRVVSGVDALCDDVASLRKLVERSGRHLVFDLEDDDVMLMGDRAMVSMKARVAGYDDHCVTMMVKCKFAPDARLLTLDLRFDVLGFAGLMKVPVGGEASPVVRS